MLSDAHRHYLAWELRDLDADSSQLETESLRITTQTNQSIRHIDMSLSEMAHRLLTLTLRLEHQRLCIEALHHQHYHRITEETTLKTLLIGPKPKTPTHPRKLCSGRYRWFGSGKAYLGIPVQAPERIEYVWVERRTDKHGTYACLMCADA